MAAPSIEALAGRPRQMPVSIFQDVESLDRIAAGMIASGGFDYDLEDPAFQDYLKKRGTLYTAGKPRTTWWIWCESPNGRTFEDFCRQEEFRFAQEYPPGSGRCHEFLPHEQAFHWARLKRAWARLADGWELYRQQAGDHPADSHQPEAEIVASPAAERAQRLLDEARTHGVEFERHGWQIDVVGAAHIPGNRFKDWKREFNEVCREFALLLPDLDSLMQAPDGFVEVSPGNYAHQDDLPTVRAMMAMSGIELPPATEMEDSGQDAPPPPPPKRKPKTTKPTPAELARQLSLF